MFIFADCKNTSILIMKKLTTLKFLRYALFALVFAGVSISCQKPTTCTVVVNVIDQNTKQPVPGCSVVLNSTVTNAVVSGSGYTNSSGSVTFTFQLPAIFNIYCNLTNPPKSGTGIVQLQPGQTVTSTVYVTP